MFRLIFLIFIFFLINTTMANADTDIFSNPLNAAGAKEAAAKMPASKNISCKFRQERTLEGTNTILRSRGDFEYVKDKSAVFKTTYPIESTKVYSAADDVIFALSGKNPTSLERYFDIFFKSEGQNWTLGLKPKKDSKVERHLNNVIVEGAQNINKMVINTKNSGKTTIYFE